MEKKYFYIILIMLIIAVILGILLFNNNNDLKSDLGSIYNSSLFYCNFTLDNLNNVINNDLDIEKLKLYEAKVYELPNTIRRLHFNNMEFILVSIDVELNKAIEEISKGNDATEEFKIILQLTQIFKDAYDMLLNKCGDDDLLWYKYINNKEFESNINKFITDNYNKLYKQ